MSTDLSISWQLATDCKRYLLSLADAWQHGGDLYDKIRERIDIDGRKKLSLGDDLDAALKVPIEAYMAAVEQTQYNIHLLADDNVRTEVKDHLHDCLRDDEDPNYFCQSVELTTDEKYGDEICVSCDRKGKKLDIFCSHKRMRLVITVDGVSKKITPKVSSV